MHKKGLKAIAIAGIFSPVNPQHEERAAEIVAEEIPQALITLSPIFSNDRWKSENKFTRICAATRS